MITAVHYRSKLSKKTTIKVFKYSEISTRKSTSSMLNFCEVFSGCSLIAAYINKIKAPA